MNTQDWKTYEYLLTKEHLTPAEQRRLAQMQDLIDNAPQPAREEK